MLSIPGTWVWDSWTIDDGPDHHLFFLQAPAEGDPDQRHFRARVGHAVSTDWVTWTVLPDVLAPASGPAWDDLAIWTGSVVRGPSGRWHFFYTALSQQDSGRIQRIGRADSDDLISWSRASEEPLVQADPRWYETFSPSNEWHQEAWRDPWVLPDPHGDGWHMLITARGHGGDAFDRGVIGHARSTDLARWEVQPPLTEPAGFGQLEVSSTVLFGEQWLLLFCCMATELSPARRSATPASGMWSAPALTPIGPFDLSRATPFAETNLYAAHLVPGDQDALIGFTVEAGDDFAGWIGPPVPVRLGPLGTLEPA